MEVEGLFLGGPVTVVASSEEELVSEDGDEGGCGFVWVGLAVEGALEAAQVEEGVLGAGFLGA